nr:myb-like protein I [Ipomoea batatas]
MTAESGGATVVLPWWPTGRSAVKIRDVNWRRQEKIGNEGKLTLIGKFLKEKHQIDEIRAKFKKMFVIGGAAHIGVLDIYSQYFG